MLEAKEHACITVADLARLILIIMVVDDLLGIREHNYDLSKRVAHAWIRASKAKNSGWYPTLRRMHLCSSALETILQVIR